MLRNKYTLLCLGLLMVSKFVPLHCIFHCFRRSSIELAYKLANKIIRSRLYCQHNLIWLCYTIYVFHQLNTTASLILNP